MIPKLIIHKDIEIPHDKVTLCNHIDELLSMNEKMKQELEELKMRVEFLD